MVSRSILVGCLFFFSVISGATAAPGDPVATYGMTGYAVDFPGGASATMTDVTYGDAPGVVFGAGIAADDSFVVTKRGANGALVSGFGTSGLASHAITTPGGPAFAEAVAFNGSNVFVAGDDNNDFLVVAALNPTTGALDGTTFGTGGVTKINLVDVQVADITVDNGTNVFVSGYHVVGAAQVPFVLKLNVFGAPDTTFGGDGFVELTPDAGASSTGDVFTGVAWMQDDETSAERIVATGLRSLPACDFCAVAARFEADGDLDPTFATGGIYSSNGVYNGAGVGVVEDSSDGIRIAGYRRIPKMPVGFTTLPMVLALDEAGSPRAGFGTDGRAELVMEDATAVDSIDTASGDIVATIRRPGAEDGLGAWTSLGAIDSSFSGDGFAALASADIDARGVVNNGDSFIVGGSQDLGATDRHVAVAIEAPGGGTPPPASVVEFTANGYQVTEGSFETLALTRTNPSAPGSVRVRLTAPSADISFADQLVSFGAGEATKFVQVVPVNDTADETDPEVVQFELFDAVGLQFGTRKVTSLLIHDNDEPVVTKDPGPIVGGPGDPFAKLNGYIGLLEVKELTKTGTIGVQFAPRKVGVGSHALLGDAAARNIRFDDRRGGNYLFTNVPDIQRQLNALRYDPTTGSGYYIAMSMVPTALQDIDPSYRKLIAAGDVWDQRDGAVQSTSLQDPLKFRLRYYEPQLNCGPNYSYVDADLSRIRRERAAKKQPWTWEEARTYLRTFGQGYDWFNCEIDVVYKKRAGITRSQVTGENAVQQRGKWVLQFTVDIPKEKPAPKLLPCPIADINSKVLNGQSWDDSARGKADGTHNVYDAYKVAQSQDLYACRFDAVFDKMAGVTDRRAYRVDPPSGADPVATIHVWEPKTPDLVTTVRFNATSLVTGGLVVPPLQDGKLTVGTTPRLAVTVTQAGVAVDADGNPITKLGGAEVNIWFDPNGNRNDAVQVAGPYYTGDKGSSHAGQTEVIELSKVVNRKLTPLLTQAGTLRFEVTWRGVGSDGKPVILNGWHTFQVVARKPGCYQAAVPGSYFVQHKAGQNWYLKTSCSGKAAVKSAANARGANYDKCISSNGNGWTCLGAALADLFGQGVSGSQVPVPAPANQSVSYTCKGGDVVGTPKLPQYGVGTAVVLGASAGREGKSNQVMAIPPTCVLTAQAVAKPGVSGASNGVIATGGGNVIATGGLNVISTGGGNVISTGGGNVISTGGGNVIATGGGNVIGTGGLN